MDHKQRACVIGAGMAGLCALRHALAHGLEAVAYEQCKEVGGTWICMDREEGQSEEDVHSSMYEGLRTNLPKEIMGYPDYDYDAELNESFISAKEVLNYLQSYAEHYKLTSHIRLQHEIVRVRPWNGKWEVIVRDMRHNKFIYEYCQFVLVCNGHFTTPLYPNTEGINCFRGEKLHSHLYRKPEIFKDHTVLVIGAGPSGLDITHHAHQYAKAVYLSHHMPEKPNTDFMPNVIHKPDVVRFTATGAIFQDGSSADITFVVFCTGYKYTFPFLSVDCGLSVDGNYVQPLYKHCLNINHPSMAIIGLPHKVCPAQLFDLQVRFVLKIFTKQCQLPSKEDMLMELQQDMSERWASGLSKRVAHEMGKKQFDYYKDLADTAGIQRIKPVVEKIMLSCGKKYTTELATYRNNHFRIIDDENFIKTSASEH